MNHCRSVVVVIATVAAQLAACGPGARAGSAADASVAVDPDAAVRADAGPPLPLPTTCEEAALQRSYVGCEYWPTVVANNVWSIFDYAVVVANAGIDAAEITVSGPGDLVVMRTVPAGGVETIFLPWVPALKGADFDECGLTGVGPEHLLPSARADGGAYHLVSTRPVTVYQFSALEYQPEGGPSGKDWSTCPGLLACERQPGSAPLGCFSFSNDATLLLPVAALTATYRITGYPTIEHNGVVWGSTFSVTGTVDGTEVTVTLPSDGAVMAGGELAARAGGETFTFQLDAGDVVRVANADGEPRLRAPSLFAGGDLSGALVRATHPVQVITGSPCTEVPALNQACDHIEEANLPAEAMGSDYLVTVPTSPDGQPTGHLVRLYGNFDDTALIYDPPIEGAPTRIDAGQVLDVASVIDVDFRVTGDKAFAVSSFQLGAELLLQSGPTAGMGDPAQTTVVPIEQYRQRYVFLAPPDYEHSFADVVGPTDATLTLDGEPVVVFHLPIGDTGFGVRRVRLPAGGAGKHVLDASAPVGVQVMGYGDFTSYQYPAGLELRLISPIP